MSTLYKYNPSATTVSGEWSGNTLPTVGMCSQVYIKSTTATTTFNVTITDRDDIVVRQFTNVKGLVNDLTPFPVQGIYTVAISSASADEIFTVALWITGD